MQPKVKRIYMPRIKIVFAIVVFFLAVILFTKGFLWARKLVMETGLTPLTIAKLIVNGGATLKKFDERTNVLILGIGGGTHAGADLTDTIMVLSLDHSGPALALISLPRDLWSETLKDKVNSAYHYGEEKKKGGGLVLSKVIVEDMIGLPVQYAMVVDFSVFQDVIDFVGGITIAVPHTFTDSEFPIEGKEDEPCDGDPQLRCRYEALHFDAGTQQMDGSLALKYVRSRQAVGEEGSDFARSSRQQEVLVALKQKLTAPSLWLSPLRVKQLLVFFEKAIDSDMKIGELATVGKLFARVPEERIRRISLENELYTPPAIWYGRYVLIPKESFEAIHEYIKEQLNLKR